MTGLTLLLISAAGVPAVPLMPADGRRQGDGRWLAEPSPYPAVRQASPSAGPTSLLSKPVGTGSAWRCVVEPGPYGGRAGLWFGCSSDGANGLRLVLGGNPSVGGLELLAPDGGHLWRDRFMAWNLYTPVVLEAVVSAGRTRVQAFEPARGELLAQSDWIAVPDGEAATGGECMGFFTEGNTARFCLWERCDEPLSPIVPNSPSKLRLLQEGEAKWEVIGGGTWQWQDQTRRILCQKLKTERTTAFMTDQPAAEGTWRCRIRLDKGTCGGGMLLHADRDLTRGFLVWLGGTYGDGCLMLYRYPISCAWASGQGKWHWDTDYVLEGTIREGKASARMLETDGETVIAESPAVALTPEEAGRRGMRGFQTWRGTGRFTGFSAATSGATATADETSGRMSALGPDWRVEDGEWHWSGPDRRILKQRGPDPAAALLGTVHGSRGVFRCTVKPGQGASEVALLFQVSRDGGEGFACVLGGGLALRRLGGDVLWSDESFQWSPGTSYRLEGRVMTDRVQVRVLDAQGGVLGESVARYVSDTNNGRDGCIGFRTSGGAAEFSDWGWTGEEGGER